jgi:hypothetical protein
LPRRYPPPLLPAPIPAPFELGEAQKRDLARALGLAIIPPQLCDAIEVAIANYKAEAAGSSDTTIGNTLAELAELKKKGRQYDKVVARLADDRSGIDYVTHDTLQPLAKAVLANAPNAQEALAQAAQGRMKELRLHKRILPRAEALRFFCGVLREIFRHSASPAMAADAWHNCRRFALEVLTVGGFDHADFDAHPERLTEYLGTDVSTN